MATFGAALLSGLSRPMRDIYKAAVAARQFQVIQHDPSHPFPCLVQAAGAPVAQLAYGGGAPSLDVSSC
jgi:hypothetical protein